MRIAFAIVSLVLGSSAAIAAPCTESDKTAAAVQCVETHWSRAFMTGDGAYLTDLLGDDYHSYGAAGVGHDRAAIVGFARDYAKQHPNAAIPASNPGDIQLRGDVAIVFWREKDGTLKSVDAFTWSNGHWHAWYSQHSSAEK